jgi:hypothetical protein
MVILFQPSPERNSLRLLSSVRGRQLRYAIQYYLWTVLVSKRSLASRQFQRRF